LREALAKACVSNPNSWPEKLPLALFADRITVSRVTGYSPFQLLHGCDPVLPLDLAESTFLVTGFRAEMSTSDLLAARIHQLERRPDDLAKAAETLRKARFASKAQFERWFMRKLKTDDFHPGQLVLLRNSAREGQISAAAKMAVRYMGPYVVVRKNRGHAYELREPDGAELYGSYPPRRLLPY
ncbi:hypothetical protein GGF50DRAFT_16928, partial [Schizophyllum commune]